MLHEVYAELAIGRYWIQTEEMLNKFNAFYWFWPLGFANAGVNKADICMG
ncbi:MAG: hypothetical protein AB4063_24190 [Crocosphaera sp.]